MGEFSTQEIDSQYILIKMVSVESEKYRDIINGIMEDTAYMPFEIKVT